MKLLFDFFPILLFFISYKLYGFYVATIVALTTLVLQVFGYWIKYRRIETVHKLTLVIMLILGGTTLISHNEMFFKWKPTVINWAFAVVFLGSQIFTHKPLIKRMMDQNVVLPDGVWTRLNIVWIIFFILMGIANLYVVYNFDTNTWVNFKLFGVLGLTVLFVIVQAIYMARHIDDEATGKLQDLNANR